MVSRKDGSWPGRAGFERGYIRDTARVRRVDRGYIRSSIKAGNFLPDHTRPSHKNWSALSGSWLAVWCECSLSSKHQGLYFVLQ